MQTDAGNLGPDPEQDCKIFWPNTKMKKSNSTYVSANP
jgi:hypothetical protein